MTNPERRAAGFDPAQYHGIPAGYYDQVYRRGRGVQWFWHEHRFRTVRGLLPAAGGRLLDVGCGPGTFLGHFADGYQEALGIDLADAQIAYAQEHYTAPGRRFEAVDASRFRDREPFDAIVSIELIEHLPAEETRPFLELLRGLLVPGGTLVLTTPNYRSAWPALEWMVSRRGPVDYRLQHINPFNRGRLSRELAAAGFEVGEVGTFFVLAPFLASASNTAASALHWAESRFLGRLGAELYAQARRPR
jgi:SAM-dependent methyltransferase